MFLLYIFYHSMVICLGISNININGWSKLSSKLQGILLCTPKRKNQTVFQFLNSLLLKVIAASKIPHYNYKLQPQNLGFSAHYENYLGLPLIVLGILLLFAFGFAFFITCRCCYQCFYVCFCEKEQSELGTLKIGYLFCDC